MNGLRSDLSRVAMNVRRLVSCLVIGTALFTVGGCSEGRAAQHEPSLRRTATNLFELGVGISDNIARRTNDWPLLTSQFSGNRVNHPLLFDRQRPKPAFDAVLKALSN